MLFNYDSFTVRSFQDEHGEIWFVAKDVCDVLGISNARDAASTLDDDEKMTVANTDGHSGQRGGAQFFNIINEAGLYALIFRSNKPEAKEFGRWVRHEVLPQIMHTGSFSLKKEQPPLPAGVLDGAKIIFEAAGITGNQQALALDKVYKSYTGRSALQVGEVNLVAPTTNQLLTPTQIGQHFGVSGRRVNQVLSDFGFQHKEGAGYEPLALGEPYAVMIDTNKWHSDGTPIRQLKWTSSILNEVAPLFK